MRGYKLDIRKVKYEKYDGKEKLKHVLNVMEKDGDIALVLDADTLITNQRTKIENFLEDGKDLYFTTDMNGLNTGTFIVRKSTWSTYFLSQAFDLIGNNELHCEQDAIAYLIRTNKPEDLTRIKLLDHPSINSFKYELYPEYGEQDAKLGQWVPGCFILHLAAMPNEKRIEIFQNTQIVA